ncbi:MAG: dihydroneopterin aldolase [Bacteroidetes bacterium]|nr:MAG: dihydroneopterin aldolase [Bacteroidota bacterium]
MVTISLHHLKFHGFHGCYEQEKITGNEFEVNLDVSFNESISIITSLHESINYVTLYHLVKKKMKETTPLLETIAMELADEIKRHFPQVLEVDVAVKKINPPIISFQGSTSVRFRKHYQT